MMPTDWPTIRFTNCCSGGIPIAATRLASQPTISRFENAWGARTLYAMGRELAANVIDRHRRRLHGRARRITIDLDPTDDPTHGAQQLTFFNGHYDSWCYLPLLAFLTFNDEAEQYLCAAILRPGNAPATRGALGPVAPPARAADSRFRGRASSCGSMAALRRPRSSTSSTPNPRLDYVVAMAENSRVDAVRRVGDGRGAGDERGERADRARLYRGALCRRHVGRHERRVVIKAEVVRLPGRDPRDNPRFVITNLRQSPRFVYEQVYCARGDIENRIKELHDGLQIGRTSCCRFWANQLRVLLTAAAYVLMQELRCGPRAPRVPAPK
jgi:hypothetical protein